MTCLRQVQIGSEDRGHAANAVPLQQALKRTFFRDHLFVSLVALQSIMSKAHRPAKHSRHDPDLSHELTTVRDKIRNHSRDQPAAAMELATAIAKMSKLNSRMDVLTARIRAVEAEHFEAGIQRRHRSAEEQRLGLVLFEAVQAVEENLEDARVDSRGRRRMGLARAFRRLVRDQYPLTWKRIL
jgi:hypothetical protein